MPENDQEPNAAVTRIRRTIDRLTAEIGATRLAAPALGAAAGVLLALTVRRIDARSAWNAGLACGVTAAGLACTTAILRAMRDTAIQECHVMEYFDARLRGVENVDAAQLGLLRNVMSTAKDDLGKRRNGHG